MGLFESISEDVVLDFKLVLSLVVQNLALYLRISNCLFFMFFRSFLLRLALLTEVVVCFCFRRNISPGFEHLNKNRDLKEQDNGKKLNFTSKLPFLFIIVEKFGH